MLEISTTLPIDDPSWEEYTPNVAYIRFPASLSLNWSVQPTTLANTYGFIELSVKEGYGVRFERIWKPLRGMVGFYYSPTQLI